MRVVVAAASKHGATAEIAERIGEVLGDRGLDVTVSAPGRAEALDADAYVVGSAVYAGHWLPEAKDFAQRLAGIAPPPAVWLFSSGPVGDPPKPDEEPVDVADILEATQAREHRLFSGKIDRRKLGFGEKAIVIAFRAPDGDFRDWETIAGWATGIADALGARPATAGHEA